MKRLDVTRLLGQTRENLLDHFIQRFDVVFFVVTRCENRDMFHGRASFKVRQGDIEFLRVGVPPSIDEQSTDSTDTRTSTMKRKIWNRITSKSKSRSRNHSAGSLFSYSRVEFRLIKPMSIRTILCRLTLPG